MESGSGKQTILIIDDDKFLLDMYALRFARADFRVEAAVSAEQALKQLRNGLVPAVILLDIVMLIMDGFEFLQIIRQEQLAPQAVKIILSNLGQEQDFQKGKELGAATYIVKANSTPSEVVARINQSLVELQK